MTSHYQNQAYQPESAPTEHLHQNLGFSPVYQQQQQPTSPYYGPPYQSNLREPATGRPSALYHPTPPSLQQQPQPLFVTSANGVPAYEQQVPPCSGDITAPYYNPNAPPPPPPPTLTAPRLQDSKCYRCSFKYSLYLLVIIGFVGPLVYYYC